LVVGVMPAAQAFHIWRPYGRLAISS